jgi:DNA-binding transcriptional LysR family regulator
MELRRVRYFVAVAENLHFRRAAEKMNVVQSAISQQVRRFEDELGVELFERSGHEVRLTEAGRLMLPECRKLILQAEETARVAQQANAGARGRINFALIDNAICSLFPPLVRAFSCRYPDIELTLQGMDWVEQTAALNDRQIDIGLMPAPRPDGDFESEAFVRGPLVAALPRNHPLASQASLSLERLSNEPFVLFPAAKRSRILEVILSACSQRAFTPRVVQEAPQMHTLLALVDAGLGVTLVPQWVASMEVHDVAFRPIDPPAPIYELIFTWRRDNSNRALAGLLEIGREVAQK